MHLEYGPEENRPFVMTFTIDESYVVRDAFQARINELIAANQGHIISLVEADLANWDEDTGPIQLSANHPRRITEVLHTYCLGILGEHSDVFKNFDLDTKVDAESDEIIPITESVEKALSALEIIESIRVETGVMRLLRQLDDGLAT